MSTLSWMTPETLRRPEGRWAWTENKHRKIGWEYACPFPLLWVIFSFYLQQSRELWAFFTPCDIGWLSIRLTWNLVTGPLPKCRMDTGTKTVKWRISSYLQNARPFWIFSVCARVWCKQQFLIKCGGVVAISAGSTPPHAPHSCLRPLQIPADCSTGSIICHIYYRFTQKVYLHPIKIMTVTDGSPQQCWGPLCSLLPTVSMYISPFPSFSLCFFGF